MRESINITDAIAVHALNNSMYVISDNHDIPGENNYITFFSEAMSAFLNAEHGQVVKTSRMKPVSVTLAPPKLFDMHGILITTQSTKQVPEGGVYFSRRVEHILETPFRLHEKHGFTYHKVIVYDVNQDGLLDLLACRTSNVLQQGELVWLQPISRKIITLGWNEMIIGPYCDKHLELSDIDRDGNAELISASSKKGSIHILVSSNGRFDDSIHFSVRRIESGNGKIKGIQVIDVDGDGTDDILYSVTSNIGNGQLYCLEKPASRSLMKGTWYKNFIGESLRVHLGSKSDGAPGNVVAYYPKHNTMRPHIILSGAGSRKAYILNPETFQSATNWQFRMTPLNTCAGTVGSISVGWIKEANMFAAFVPCQREGKVFNFFL